MKIKLDHRPLQVAPDVDPELAAGPPDLVVAPVRIEPSVAWFFLGLIGYAHLALLLLPLFMR